MIPMLQGTRYTVRPGDNLSHIAQQNGYADWKVIYSSACNSALRRIRPDPNKVLPGDVVVLPPKASDVVQALRERLAALQRLRQQVQETFGDVARDLNEDFESAKRRGEQVDAVKTVLDILTGLGKLCVKGAKAMEKTGAELEKANDELAKEALDLASDPPKRSWKSTTPGL